MITSLLTNFYSQRRYPVCQNLCPSGIYMEMTWRKIHRDVAFQVSSNVRGPQNLCEPSAQPLAEIWQQADLCNQTSRDITQEPFLTNYFRLVEPQGSENEPVLMVFLIRNSDQDKILIFYSLDFAVLYHIFKK